MIWQYRKIKLMIWSLFTIIVRKLYELDWHITAAKYST